MAAQKMGEKFSEFFLDNRKILYGCKKLVEIFPPAILAIVLSYEEFPWAILCDSSYATSHTYHRGDNIFYTNAQFHRNYDVTLSYQRTNYVAHPYNYVTTIHRKTLISDLQSIMKVCRESEVLKKILERVMRTSPLLKLLDIKLFPLVSTNYVDLVE